MDVGRRGFLQGLLSIFAAPLVPRLPGIEAAFRGALDESTVVQRVIFRGPMVRLSILLKGYEITPELRQIVKADPRIHARLVEECCGSDD